VVLTYFLGGGGDNIYNIWNNDYNNYLDDVPPKRVKEGGRRKAAEQGQRLTQSILQEDPSIEQDQEEDDEPEGNENEEEENEIEQIDVIDVEVENQKESKLLPCQVNLKSILFRVFPKQRKQYEIKVDGSNVKLEKETQTFILGHLNIVGKLHIIMDKNIS